MTCESSSLSRESERCRNRFMPGESTGTPRSCSSSRWRKRWNTPGRCPILAGMRVKSREVRLEGETKLPSEAGDGVAIQ